MSKKRLTFSVVAMFGVLLGFASCTPDTATIPSADPNPSKEKLESRTALSVASKLYWVAQLMDKHEQWDRISELLREIIEANIENEFVLARVKKVKQYVDNEPHRAKVGVVRNSKLDTHSFLEARLLIVECIQELRPRLNLSWTGEVRLLKQMLFTAIFPHAEGEGEIEFPKPETYSFDLFAYTAKNIKALMIAPGGKPLTPLFRDYVTVPKKRNTYPYDDENSNEDDQNGTSLTLKKLTFLQDRIQQDLMAEGVDPHKLFGDSDYDPDRDTYYPPYPGDDSDYGDYGSGDYEYGRSEAEERIISLKRIYRYVKRALHLIESHRSIDDYEPLTLLMIAVSNPALIEQDPQLRAFVAGIKLKFQVAEEDSEGKEFKPGEYDYKLVQKVNDALTPSSNLKFEFQTNKRGHRALFIVSNLNGGTNVLHNLVSFRNAVTLIQTLRWMPPPVVKAIQLTPEGISRVFTWINQALPKLDAMSLKSMPHFIVAFPLKVSFSVIAALGEPLILKGAQKATTFLKAWSEKPIPKKTINIVKSDKFFYGVLAASVAADLANGGLEAYYAEDRKTELPKIAIKTISKVSSSLIYLVKSRPVILSAALLDLGHLALSNRVPSGSQIIESMLNFLYEQEEVQRTGHTPRFAELTRLKEGLTIADKDDALNVLKDYERGIQDAKELKDLDNVRTALGKALSLYAAKRLVYHYVTVTALNGRGDRELGQQLRTFSEEHERIFWTWYQEPGSGAEQKGLNMLDRDFDKRYAALGGTLPEKPKPQPKKDKSTKKDKKDAPDASAETEDKGSSKTSKEADPWDDF